MSTIDHTEQALPTGTWAADPVHSSIGFAVDYMAGTFSGTFSDVAVEVAEGTIAGSAKVASIEVKDADLEAHLQSPDFFDAERHPELTFRSREIVRDGNGIRAQGELAMKGHTEQVEITGRVIDPFGDPFGMERFGLRLETTVDRTAFGMSWNNPLPTGEPALSNDVTITADLQLVRQS